MSHLNQGSTRVSQPSVTRLARLIVGAARARLAQSGRNDAEADEDDRSRTVEGSRGESEAAASDNDEAARPTPADGDDVGDAPESGTRGRG